MQTFILKNKVYFIFSLIYFCIAGLTLYKFNGTGDVGDSVAHFLFAKWAPKHPSLYFHHWAKPVFVLLASPFAQFGFVGVKIMNVFIGLATILITYRFAVKLKIANAVLILPILLFSPLFYILTFSSLTEPLFALFVALALLLISGQKIIPAFVLLSFLPYVRSEGLIIIGVFALYAIYTKAWKALPYLLLGSVVYAIAGYGVHHDVFWVFTKIPYAKLSSIYGSGPLFHFVFKLINVCGIPNYLMFWIGFIVLFFQLFRKKFNAFNHLLLLGGFLAFFIAHSLFWFLGIFNSMGLQRVLLCIMPITACIVLFGFNGIYYWICSKSKIPAFVFKFVWMIYLVIFPFTPNPAAIQWKKDMCLTEEQSSLLLLQACNVMSQTYHGPLLYNHHYISEVLNLDHFDVSKHQLINRENIRQMKSGNVMVWDNKYTLDETGIDLPELLSNPNLRCVCKKSVMNINTTFTWAVFVRK